MSSTIQEIVNYVRSTASSTYRELIPNADANTLITDISNPLNNYEPLFNEFVSGLVNRIGLEIIHNKIYTNPLGLFKKGAVPLGTDIEDIYTNPVQKIEYDPSETGMARLLKKYDPDTKVTYYRRNRRDTYPLTISKQQLQAAFLSWEKLEKFVASFTNAQYSGDYKDEFRYTKGLIDSAYVENKIIMQQITAPTDETTGKAFVKVAKKLYANFKFPSNEYNAYYKITGDSPVETWSDQNTICMIATAETLANIDVDVLAKAFNIDKTTFMGRIVEIDRFQNPEIKAVICDESFFQIYNNLLEYAGSYNPATLSWNYFLHSWDIFALCPFANAVALVTALPTVKTTDITLPTTDLTIVKGTPKTFNVSTVPTNTTDSLTAGTVSKVTTSITGIPYNYAVTVTVASDFSGSTLTLPLTSGTVTKNLVLTVS